MWFFFYRTKIRTSLCEIFFPMLTWANPFKSLCLNFPERSVNNACYWEEQRHYHLFWDLWFFFSRQKIILFCSHYSVSGWCSHKWQSLPLWTGSATCFADLLHLVSPPLPFSSLPFFIISKAPFSRNLEVTLSWKELEEPVRTMSSTKQGRRQALPGWKNEHKITKWDLTC